MLQPIGCLQTKALLIKGPDSFQSFGFKRKPWKEGLIECETLWELQVVTQQSIGKSREHLRGLQNAWQKSERV